MFVLNPIQATLDRRLEPGEVLVIPAGQALLLDELPMKKPTIAIVAPDPSFGGGVPAVAKFLYRIINESGAYQADLISLATSARDEASVRLLWPPSWVKGARDVDGVDRGVRFRHFGALLVELEFQRYKPRRKLTAALNGYDIVQVVSGSPAWALVARDVRPPVVLQVATLIRHERSTRLCEERRLVGLWRRRMTSIIERLDFEALRRVEAVFVENDWMFSRLRQSGDCRQVIYAPPGVDSELFCPFHDRCGDFILSVGRFDDARKNVRLLFAAYDLLRRELPGTPRLILAGETGPRPEDWDLAVSLGVADHIEVRMEVPVPELAELYRNAALFVLPSNEEGLGIVLLEAMASGTPVVSTRCGGPESVIADRETGFLTPVGDAQALATRMRQLLESPQLRRDMGAAGRRTIVERFSLAAAGRAFLDKYNELLMRRGRPCVV